VCADGTSCISFERDGEEREERRRKGERKGGLRVFGEERKIRGIQGD